MEAHPPPRGHAAHGPPFIPPLLTTTWPTTDSERPRPGPKYSMFPPTPPPSYPLPQIPRKSPRRLNSSHSGSNSRPSTAQQDSSAPVPAFPHFKPGSPEFTTALPSLQDHLHVRINVDGPRRPSSVYDNSPIADTIRYVEQFPQPPADAAPISPPTTNYFPTTPAQSATSSRAHTESFSVNSTNERLPVNHLDPVMWDYITDVVIDPTQHAMFHLLRKWLTYDVSNKNCLFWLQSRKPDTTSILMKRLTRNIVTIPASGLTSHARINIGISLRSSGASREPFTLTTLLRYALAQALIQMPQVLITLGRHLPVSWMENVHYPSSLPELPLATLKAAFDSLVFQTETPILLMLYLDAFDQAEPKACQKIHEYLKEVRKQAASPKNFLSMKTRFLFAVSSGVRKSVKVVLPKPVTNWDWVIVKLDELKPEIPEGRTSWATSNESGDGGSISGKGYGVAR